MTRSLFARRMALLASLFVAAALSGCPAAEERPAVDTGSPTAEADTETVDIVEVDESSSDSSEPNAASDETTPRDSAEGQPPSIGPVATGAEPAPAVAIERPSDFLRPTLPDAALQAQIEEEPADPPEAVTDRSAEAKDPHVLPGGTPVGDLFEGLEGKPSGESND